MNIADISGAGGRLAALLAEGYALSFAEAAGTGGWFADLRDGRGRVAETGLGATQAEALAHLAERAERLAVPVLTRTAAELAEALGAAREAIDIPHAATFGGDQKRAEILQVRVVDAVIMLNAVLGESCSDPAWSVDYCREQLAKHPATGYRTWDEVVAEQRAAKASAS